MRRKGLLLFLALVLVGAILVVLWLLTPAPPVAEKPVPPPVAKPRTPPLQADAEGHYVPGYAFTVSRYRFTGFTLRPEAYATFGQSGSEQQLACLEARITPGSFHLRCDDPQLGTVTIDGRFLTRFVSTRLDAPVVTAVVTVRDGAGEVLYKAQDSFEWRPAN